MKLRSARASLLQLRTGQTPNTGSIKKDLVGTVQRRHHANNMSGLTFLHRCIFYVQFLEKGAVDLVNELVDFDNHKIGPNELTAGAAFLQTLVSEPHLKQGPIHKAVLGGHPIHMWKTECKRVDLLCLCPLNLCRPRADAKHMQINVRPWTSHIQQIKAKYWPWLACHLGGRMAKLEVALYMGMFLKSLFSTPWPYVEPNVHLPMGRFALATHKGPRTLPG